MTEIVEYMVSSLGRVYPHYYIGIDKPKWHVIDIKSIIPPVEQYKWIDTNIEGRWYVAYPCGDMLDTYQIYIEYESDAVKCKLALL